MTTIVFIFEKFSHPGDKEKKANKYKGFSFGKPPHINEEKKNGNHHI